MTKFIIRNAIKTPDGTIIESMHRHDFQSHTDTVTGEFYFVDGGIDYLRRGGGKYEDLSIFADETTPVADIREHLKWGTYGKDGIDPLSFVALRDMEDDHIRAVIDQMRPSERGDFVAQKMHEELEYRKSTGQ